MEIDQGQLLKTIASFLEENKIPYMLTGALSVVYYGRPRASHDIDFVVEVPESDTKRVTAALSKLPKEFTFQSEAAEEAIASKGMFSILHTPTMLKLDFWLLQNDQFDKTRFLRRQRVTLLGLPMMITSAEDTILKKLVWYKESQSEKHFIDAAFVYQIQNEELDAKYLEEWIQRLDVVKFYRQLNKIDLEEYL